MKRQHPDNPDLFWCPTCKSYKARTAFGNNKTKKCGISTECIVCHRNRYYIHREAILVKQKEYRQNNIEKIKLRVKESYKKHGDKYRAKKKETYASNPEKTLTKNAEWRRNNKDKKRATDKKYNETHREQIRINMKKYIDNHPEKRPSKALNDSYIRCVIKYSHLKNPDYSPKMIELVRQRIIMKRTLKEFKKWRQENESDYTNVYGKQQPDEENHEGRI